MKFSGTKMSKEDKNQWRVDYNAKLDRLFKEYTKILVIDIDNIRANQLAATRRLLRGQAELVFGKKTLINRYLTHQQNEELKKLMEHVRLNVGFIFTNGDFKPIMQAFADTRRKAAAKAGMVAPDDVVIQPQITGLGPEATSFFSALKIDTKINKNKVEITRAVPIIKKGEIVTPNQAALLQKLEMVPFFYQTKVNIVYDNGNLIDAGILEVDEEVMLQKWNSSLSQFVGLALGANIPVLPAVPHVIIDTMKTMLGFGVESNLNMIPDVKRIADLLAKK
ncbi:Acidic_ribosomal protein P0 [Hexamita inflata]|uniref:Acidic ribosomal protein P0 n=1 Tax=Hexamita inflata TaxID=28002 RepID=A0AA86NIW1_9EUKA|nr:Acidic ribosomal protein P0 [Hexamita inflata]CAI9977510.1 Acidic ribosomal protein P0 [Hexamita inflata]